MKLANRNAKANLILSRLVLCAMMVILYSCDSGSGGDASSGTGSVAFSLEIQEQSVDEAPNFLELNDNNSQFKCQTIAYAIATIEALVVDENEELLAEGGPWNCEDHKGIINDVEAGDGRIVKVSAKDELGETIFWGKSEPVTVIIGQQTDAGNLYLEPVNRPPKLDRIGNRKINEGELLEFDIFSTDADGDTLLFEIGNKPVGAKFTFEDFGDGTATAQFSWKPAFDSDRNYKVIFKVTDSGVPPLSDFEEITISVGNVPQPPVLDPIKDKKVNEGKKLEFDIYATDPDSLNLSFEIENKPPKAVFTFESFGDGTGAANFRWTPGFGDSGNYPITFKVFDDYPPPDGPLSDSEEITIAVGNVCRAPKFDPILPPLGKENKLLEFTVTARDADLPDDALSFSCDSEDIPCEDYFDPFKQIFSWKPDFDDAGTYDVSFTVTDSCPDGSLSDEKDVTITVVNVCRSPVLKPIGSKYVNVNEELRFQITATDPDLPDDALSFRCVSEDISCNEYFNPSTRIFSWTPRYLDLGTYTVRFIVTDACDNPGPRRDFEDVIIVVEPECEGASCGNFENCCEVDGELILSGCARIVEGGGVCTENIICAGLQLCDSSAECDNGGLCVRDTCCKKDGKPIKVCLPPEIWCVNITESMSEAIQATDEGPTTFGQ